MKLSMNWVKEFAATEVDTKTFEERMTMSGSKVEAVELPLNLSRVVACEIKEIAQHENADKLRVCQVNIGTEMLQIVTNAANLSVGDLVPVALNGAVLATGLEIKEGELRGVKSFGMFCGLAELGLTAADEPEMDENGVIILNNEGCKAGDLVADVLELSDTIVEFEITPNRADCLSVYGLAREISATFNVPINSKEIAKIDFKKDTADEIKVAIDDENLCQNYAAAIVKNVVIKPSPRFIRRRLTACGIRPINNIVDITNYVLLEFGQPMHAFDLAKITGGEIIARAAKNGEKIKLIDGGEVNLGAEILVIADGKNPLALAGVMGGFDSAISENTTEIVFESARFCADTVRKSAAKYVIRTESGARFEKGIDPNLYEKAIFRALELVEITNSGTVEYAPVKIGENPTDMRFVEFDAEFTNRLLGCEISAEEQQKILKSLQFDVDSKAGFIGVPKFRLDVSLKADIAEEIARIYGYDNLPVNCEFKGFMPLVTKDERVAKKLRDGMVGLGFYQTLTYSFGSEKEFDKLNLGTQNSLRNGLKILNPLGEDSAVMRTCALGSILSVISFNLAHSNANLNLFEIAKCYNGAISSPIESNNLVGISTTLDFYGLKAKIKSLLETIGIKNSRFIAAKSDFKDSFHPNICADIFIDDVQIGTIGKIHPLVCENYDINCDVCAVNLDVSKIVAKANLDEVAVKPLPKFPAVTRDLSLICDKRFESAKIIDTIKSAGKNLVETVDLFDVYAGKGVQDDKKACAYKIVLRDENATLRDEQVEEVMAKILKSLNEIGVELRG